MTMMTQMTVLPLGEKHCHYRHLRHWKVVIQMANERVPVWEKANLSLEDAAAYFGIGINKLREMTDDSTCTFVVFNGTKRLIKRKKLEECLADTDVI